MKELERIKAEKERREKVRKPKKPADKTEEK